MVWVFGPQMLDGQDLPEPAGPLKGHCPPARTQSTVCTQRKRQGASFIILKLDSNIPLNLGAKGDNFIFFLL